MDHKLYCDKYKPKTLNDAQFNQVAIDQLKSCACFNNSPHLIIHGSEGSGRKTMALLYLKSKYNLTKLYSKYQEVEIVTNNKKINIQMLYSDYHYQFDPSMYGVYDRVIVQKFIKNILQTKPIYKTYHTIIITNADRLTFEAQQSLRRTLEKNINNSRFIFLVSRESSLIEPIVSRCIQVRLSLPNNDQIYKILDNIRTNENILIDNSQLKQIIILSKRNLSKAMNLLQLYHLNPTETLTNSTDQCLSQLTYDIINAKIPSDILIIRNHLYDLLVQCIDPLNILKEISYLILEHLENIKAANQIKINLINILSKYSNTLRQGSKPIYHLQGMCIDIMMLLNKSQQNKRFCVKIKT